MASTLLDNTILNAPNKYTDQCRCTSYFADRTAYLSYKECYWGCLPLCRVLMKRLSQFQKCLTYLARFKPFWTRLLLIQYNFSLSFHLASRQSCEVWVLQFAFLYTTEFTVPVSEACLYGCISLNRAQVQQLLWSGLSQSLP